MDQVVHEMQTLNEAKNTVEIVVHLSEDLEDRQRNNLVISLGEEDSIVSAEFCPLRYHLMLVKYDRDKHSSQDVLNAFKAKKLQARLIGPI